MRWFVPLVFVVVLILGCSGAAPTALPASTVDVSATVEAAVEATRAVDRSVSATSEARAAVPSATPVPTATPVVMTLLVPTPEAFVVAPGDVEESVGRLYDCLQGDQELRSSMLPGMKSNLSESGWSREEIDFLFEDRETFLDLFLSTAEESPDFAVMAAAWGKVLDEFCGESPLGSVRTPEPLVVAQVDLEETLGEFYDCMQENEALRSMYFLGFRSDLSDAGFSQNFIDTMEGAFLEDRDLFLEFVLPVFKGDPTYAKALSDSNIRDFTNDLCGDEPSASVRQFAVSHPEAEDLLGELFDCWSSLEGEAREAILSAAFEPGDVEIVESLFSDRESFLELTLLGVSLNPEAGDQLVELDEILDGGCRQLSP